MSTIGNAGCGRGPWPGRAGRGAPVNAGGASAGVGGGARGGQLRFDRERELFDDGLAAEAGELGAQLEVLRDEALVLAGEQLPDLLQCLDITYLVERPHDAAQ